MIKTHKKSKIYLTEEADLNTISGVILQVEHTPKTSWYSFLVEVVSKSAYDAEMEHDLTIKELERVRSWHEQLCKYIFKVFDYSADIEKEQDIETLEIKDRNYLKKALELANNWFC